MTQHEATPSVSSLGLLLALGVAAVWGLNFVVVKMGVSQIPPLTFCAIRFFLCFFPAIFFISKPKAPWKYIIGYGLLTFALQFSFLFAGIALGVTPGIAALMMQLGVFFAILFAYLLINQTISPWQLVGALISFTGIGVIAWHHHGNISLFGFLLILGAAMSWGLGNLISVKLKAVNMLSLVIWSSFIAFFPLLTAAFMLEEPLPILMHPQQFTGLAIITLSYTTYISTYFGYGCWSWLLSRYPVASIAHFSLFTPIIAILCSALMLHESLESWKIMASVLVIAGLLLNLFGGRLFIRFSNLVTLMKRGLIKDY